MDAADAACKLPPKERYKALVRIQKSNDWNRATRVTRGIVLELAAMWMNQALMKEEENDAERTGESGEAGGVGNS